MIYLDHAATTPIDPRAERAMLESMRAAWYNPSSAYAAAGSARRALRDARRAIADMLGADPAEIVFTSGGTEANNLALRMAQGGHAVVSAIEHASVLRAAAQFARAFTLVPPGADGRVSVDAIEAALRPDTSLISVQFANNETGALQPVREIGRLARRRRIPFHCDAVQAFGHIPIDARECCVDLLSLSAHKFYGPRGAGALYLRAGMLPPPLIWGGAQEFGLRAGTENLPAICGMSAAARAARAEMDAEAAREEALMRGFLSELCARVPECAPLCGNAPRLPGVAAIHLPGLSAERAIAKLDLRGILVSGGAACASRDAAPSHVYTALGLSPTDAKCVLRVSIGRATDEAALETAARAIEAVYRQRAQ